MHPARNDKSPLQLLRQESINSRTNSITFTDTTDAWKCFKASFSKQELDGILRQHNVRKISAINNLKGHLERDIELLHKNGNKTDILPDHARYDYVFVPNSNKTCHFCRKAIERFSDSGNHSCRICDRSFHESCIRKRGHCSDELSNAAIQESRSTVGWSCTECEDISCLLLEKEKEEIMELFETVSGEDGVIDRNEFLQLQQEEYENLVGMKMPAFREKQEQELFLKIDRDNTGYIDRWEFLPHMTIRFLSRRTSSEIIKMLTPREINTFKEYFSLMDLTFNGVLPQAKTKQAYINWYKSRIKSCEENYIDWEWYGGLKENHFLESLKKSIFGTQDHHEDATVIDWDDYLKHCALHILSARPNTVVQKPLIPPMPTFLYASGGVGSDDQNNDDFYKLCDEVYKYTNYLEKKGFKY